MRLSKGIIVIGVALCTLTATAQGSGNVKKNKGKNPIVEGWYADPEGVVFGDEYWIYPTYSAPYDEQVFMDAFSSKDLVSWTKHPRVIEKSNIPWLRRALWAPAVIEANGRYYLFFGGNDIQSNEELGGIGVAVADSPAGPFRREGKILSQDESVATGAGHHSVIRGRGADEWYIVYHRRPLGETDINSRVTCIDRMYFDKNGKIKPVRMTK